MIILNYIILVENDTLEKWVSTLKWVAQNQYEQVIGPALLLLSRGQIRRYIILGLKDYVETIFL